MRVQMHFIISRDPDCSDDFNIHFLLYIQFMSVANEINLHQLMLNLLNVWRVAYNNS